MTPRLRALLIHGLGNDPGWWGPFLPSLVETGITPVPLTLPDLSGQGPESWVETVGCSLNAAPSIVIGHSLGAAVALTAAARYDILGAALLSLPLAPSGNFVKPPDGTSLSATALARVGLFLKNAEKQIVAARHKIIVHLAGENDPWVTQGPKARTQVETVVVSNAGHDLSRSAWCRALLAQHIALSAAGRRTLDPGRRLLFLPPKADGAIASLSLETIAPPPARLDIEITTRCQLSCRYCARTLYRRHGADLDMDERTFTSALSACATCGEAVFVGLGEPLLHREIVSFVTKAHAEKMRTLVVTNGMAAGRQALSALRDSGLDEITFSIDAADPALFAQARGGADIAVVMRNLAQAKETLPVSIFTALSRLTAGSLDGIVDFACSLGLPALAVTDLNFPENHEESCAAAAPRLLLEKSIRRAREKQLLLVGPNIHNVPDIRKELRFCIVKNCDDILARPGFHRSCLAPWRTAVISVDGSLTPCNCAPGVIIGNIMDTPFEALWNGSAMKKWRHSMRENKNERCRSCPRY